MCYANVTINSPTLEPSPPPSCSAEAATLSSYPALILHTFLHQSLPSPESLRSLTSSVPSPLSLFLPVLFVLSPAFSPQLPLVLFSSSRPSYPHFRSGKLLHQRSPLITILATLTELVLYSATYELCSSHELLQTSVVKSLYLLKLAIFSWLFVVVERHTTTLTID